VRAWGGIVRRTRSARRAHNAIGLAAALVAALLAGCDMCETGDLRCSGSVVQECTEMRNWEDFHDCGADQCGVGRDQCDPLFDPGFGEVWCCIRAP
jgi:hypothetical protein